MLKQPNHFVVFALHEEEQLFFRHDFDRLKELDLVCLVADSTHLILPAAVSSESVALSMLFLFR